MIALSSDNDAASLVRACSVWRCEYHGSSMMVSMSCPDMHVKGMTGTIQL